MAATQEAAKEEIEGNQGCGADGSANVVASWEALPREVAVDMAGRLSPAWQAVLAQVSAEFRAVVERVRMAGDRPSASVVRAPLAEICCSTELLQWAVSTQGLRMSARLAAEVARTGSIPALQWSCIDNGCRVDRQAFEAAAEAGRIEVLQWLRDNHLDREDAAMKSPSLSTAAARGGQLATLKWLESQGCPLTSDAYKAAAGNGHLHILQFLRCRKEAAQRSDIPDWSPETALQAAKCGHARVLSFVLREGCPADLRDCMYEAIRGGHLEAVRATCNNVGSALLQDERVDLCATAASCGHLSILQLLRERGCPWGVSTCSCAAANGHLGLLKWARGSGCPWNTDVTSWAAGRGDLEMLRWARAEGCPWTETAAWLTCKQGYIEVLAWMRAEGCPEYRCMRGKEPSECQDLE